EQFRTHTYTEHTCLNPRSQIFLSRFHTTGHHQFRPRHRSQQTFNQFCSQYITREYFAKITTYFLSETHLGHASASRSISHQTTVAHFSDFWIKQRTYHKAST